MSILRNEKFMIIITSIILLLLFAGIYLFVLFPKMEKIPQKESELSTQEQLLSVLQSKITGTNSNTFENTVALQKMVPVKELSQQLLLEIEKAEVVSRSFVVNMNFDDGDVSFEHEPVEESETAEENETVENEEEQSREEETNTITLPNGLKKTVVTLNVESPGYFEFEKFISTLENSERITVVEALDFTAGEEIIELEQSEQPIRYQVKIAAFYMPSLVDLIDQLPKMETPEPANKKTPLVKSGDL
ncbi:hypothetical protein [Robertmurraya massiliosenegalensis]|uniref:hypothetical protein n=1 Tax=Robertmurraya massiliosenegalensis TaxID=1287657 RepID=UPI0002EF77E4|nr:hypothetical protein [Robertmurraya massiliosenegalensis]